MFYGFVITEGGNRLLAKMVAGQTLELSRVVMDRGTAESAEAARKLTAPIEPGPEGTSTVPVVDGNTVNMIVEYRSDLNGGLSAGFWIGGFAVYARDPNSEDPETGDDVLIYYGSLGDAKQYVSAYAPGTAPDVRRYPVSITVTAGVTATVVYPAEAWMNAQDVADYFNGTLRPELEASLSLLIGTHNDDPDAHGGLRDMIKENANAVELAAKAAATAQETAETAGKAAMGAADAAGDAMTEARGAKDTADGAVELANKAGLEAVAAGNAAGYALAAANEAKLDAAAAVTAAGNAQEAADAALDAVTRLAHTIDAVPSQNGTLTFTGSAQSPSWNSFNPETLTMSGTTSGTNAGTYTATFTPKEGYTWGDGTNTARSVTWTIGRASISAAPSQNGTLTFTGAAQSPKWNNYDAGKLTIGGTASSTNAGSYTATFTPTANYQWSDGTNTAKSVTWTIGRASISTTPSQNGGLTYTGSAQSPSWSNYNTAQLTIGGTTSGTNAGSYAATFTPTANYQWSDGKTTAKTANWTIAKAAGTLSLNKSTMELTNGASTGTIAVTRAGDGALSAVSSNTSLATVSVSGTTVTVTGKAYGSVTITVSVAAGTNHNAPASKTCSVAVKLYNSTLNSNTWAQIREASDGGKAASIWSVGATKNIKINGTVGNTTFSNLSIDVFVIGINHNSSREGGNRIHFQIGKIGGNMVGLVDSNYGSNGSSANYFQMNAGNNNSGGWNGSSMRKTLLGNNGTPTSPPVSSLLAALPSDLRAAMKSCTKYSDNTGGGSDNTAYVTSTTDYLFLLSEFEYQGVRTYANSTEKNYQAQYDYYKAGNSKVHYKHNETATAANAWCRSVHSSNGASFCLVVTSGSASTYNAYYSWALAPGFCV